MNVMERSWSQRSGAKKNIVQPNNGVLHIILNMIAKRTNQTLQDAAEDDLVWRFKKRKESSGGIQLKTYVP